MKKMNVINSDKTKIEVEVIRYFKHENTNYLIYTLNEKDENDFLKLYIVKIKKTLFSLKIIEIKDENEWKTIQEMIKELIIQLKNNELTNFTNLDANNIKKIKIKEAKYFKIGDKLLQILLDENYKTDIDKLPSMDEISPIPIIDVSTQEQENKEIDYKSMYNDVKKENEELNNIMADMLVELGEYRTKYGNKEN